MKEAIGTSMVFNLIMVFTGVFIAILVGSIAYSKSFKIRNRIINIVEKYYGYTDEARMEIEENLSTIGYRIVNKESNLLNSSFNKPQAFVSKFDLNELLHTISAKFWFECASEYFIGFISYNFTFIPAFAIWYAASHPARPPPIIVI